ncbi:hypothetical protein HPB49_016055 [Dermacentor silvarum]|uniref:Uncharacterized protein n=1 Tax=Dermacentor silvarum TaxID=543639 RepID=A0ACB8CXZ5_DERSI|nr:hypothetical protein HPB49_016055 [Dermacentor silvarum]
MQPLAGPSRSLLSTSAYGEQYVERSDNLPTQNVRRVLKFSLTHELFPDLRQPAPADENRTFGPSSTSHQGSNLSRDSSTQSAFTSLRCKFCESECPDKASLLRHIRRHNRAISRETDALLEKLVCSLDALGAGLDDAPMETFSGWNRTANVTSEETQVRKRLATQRSCRMPAQTTQQTHRVNSSNNVGLPPGNPNAPKQLDRCVEKAGQTSEAQMLPPHRRQVAVRRNSVGPVESSQNLTNLGATLESCRTALDNVWAIQQPVQHTTSPSAALEENVLRTLQPNCAGSVEYRWQSQTVTAHKGPLPAELRASDSARSFEGLVLAQTTLSPFQYILYTANASVGDSGSDVVRPSTEVAPSNEGAASGFLNVVSAQHLYNSTPTSLLCSESQGLALQIESAATRICSIEPPAVDGSLVNPLDLTKDADGACTLHFEAQPIDDEVTSPPLLTPCTEINVHEPSSTDEFTRSVRESSDGGVLVENLSINNEQEDQHTACDEETANDGSCAQHWEQESEQRSIQEIMLSPDLHTRKKKQEKDEVVAKDEGIANEGCPEEPAYDNADVPLSAPCVPDTACGEDIVNNQSLEHRSEEQALDKAELPLPAPSARRHKGVKRKKGVSRDNVDSGARTEQRSEQYKAGSVKEAEVPAAPPGTTESASRQGTSRPKRVRAVTWYPPRYGLNDDNGPSTKASGSTSCHEDTANDGSCAQHWEQESEHISIHEIMLSPDLHTRERHAIKQKKDEVIANETSAEEPAYDNADVPLSAPCVADSACGEDIVNNQSLEHRSEDQALDKAELPLPAPSAGRHKGVKRKKGVSLDNFAYNSRSGQRSEQSQAGSVDEAEAACRSARHHRVRLRSRYFPTETRKSSDLEPSTVWPQRQQRTFHEGVRKHCLPRKTCLHQHLLWHRNERSFACKLCPKTFVIKAHLKRHLRSHTNEKPFSCSLCPKQLSSSHALKRHRLTHTGERPHKCEVCGKKFRQLPTLQAHARARHPTEISID